MFIILFLFRLNPKKRLVLNSQEEKIEISLIFNENTGGLRTLDPFAPLPRVRVRPGPPRPAAHVVPALLSQLKVKDTLLKPEDGQQVRLVVDVQRKPGKVGGAGGFLGQEVKLGSR